MSMSTPSEPQITGGTAFSARGNGASALSAFLAILGRDTVVAVREIIAFLAQALLQPLFFLFMFGKVLPSIGFAQQGFTPVLLPGIVALTVVMTALTAVSLPLVVELGYTREIEDRLLAPLPVSLVAIEKVLFATVRGLISGAVIFPLAYWMLGSGYQVRTDTIGVLIGLMMLSALMGSALGLVMGTAVPPAQISLMFGLILTPLLFTGCTFNPWTSLASLKWFQVVTLFNPLTYASEGLRSAMLPAMGGHPFPTLAIGWSLLGLSVATVASLATGIKLFHRRVVS